MIIRLYNASAAKANMFRVLIEADVPASMNLYFRILSGDEATTLSVASTDGLSTLTTSAHDGITYVETEIADTAPDGFTLVDALTEGDDVYLYNIVGQVPTSIETLTELISDNVFDREQAIALIAAATALDGVLSEDANTLLQAIADNTKDIADSSILVSFNRNSPLYVGTYFASKYRSIFEGNFELTQRDISLFKIALNATTGVLKVCGYIAMYTLIKAGIVAEKATLETVNAILEELKKEVRRAGPGRVSPR